MDFNPFALSNKTILVTGASSGIGQGIAIVCSQMGANVWITARNERRLKETAKAMSGDVHIISADLTTQDDRNALVSQLPKIDGIVHCAGIGQRIPCKMVRQQEIDEVMSINFYAPVLLQSMLLSAKKVAKGASIVFIASKAATVPSVGNALYSASKGAIISYAQCLALEVADRLIRVNCICPAMVKTDLIYKGGITDETIAEQEKQYPLKRYGTPEDIANLCVYLLSDASSWMTNSCVDVTGGGEGC